MLELRNRDEENGELGQLSPAIQAAFTALISGKLDLGSYSSDALANSICVVAEFQKADPGNAEAIRLDRELRKELSHRARPRGATWFSGLALGAVVATATTILVMRRKKA